MKKSDNKELIVVLNIMSDSAKVILKKVSKNDMRSTDEAEALLAKLRGKYLDLQAAE